MSCVERRDDPTSSELTAEKIVIGRTVVFTPTPEPQCVPTEAVSSFKPRLVARGALRDAERSGGSARSAASVPPSSEEPGLSGAGTYDEGVRMLRMPLISRIAPRTVHHGGATSDDFW